MKRTLAFLLSLMMVLSMLPAAALATEEAPVSEAPVIEAPVEEAPTVEETPVEQPAEDELQLFSDTASLTMTQNDSNVVVTYTVPDTTTAATELQLWKYDNDSDSANLVTHEYCTDTDDWDGNTFTWVIGGHSFAEHGEGHYYCTTADGTVESSKLEYTYAQTAVQLVAPTDVVLNGDSLTWTCDSPVMAVIWQGTEDDMNILDYCRVFNGKANASELLDEDAAAGLYNISLFACSADNYVNNKPSEWVTVEYQYGAPLASGDCGAGSADNLQWSLSADYVLTITGSGAMEDYSYAPWYDWAEDITAVSLPEGLTHLGASALYKCSALTQIDLPDSLESIGSRALATVGEALESLHIPANVSEIGINALGFNSALTEITVDAANTAFYMQNDCLLTADGEALVLVACPGGLTGKVTLPDGITTIGSHACCGSSADTFILPDTLTTIEDGSFFGSELTSIQIPASVTALGDEAFFRCKELDSVTFEGNAPTLGTNVFKECAGTFRIYYDPATTGWTTPEWNGWPAYPIGTAEPLSRMDMVYLLVDAFELEYNSKKMTASFPDVTDADDAEAAAIVAYYGVVRGDQQGNFNPDATLTRAEVAAILNRTLLLPAGDPLVGDESGSWYAADAAAVLSAGLMTTDNGVFNGTASADTDDLNTTVLENFAAAFGLTATVTADNLKIVCTTLESAAELELFFSDAENGPYKCVDDIDSRDFKDNWNGRSYTWVPSGAIFAEHGTGWYYAVDGNGTKTDKVHFTYADTATQLPAPEVSLNVDTGELAWTCDNRTLLAIGLQTGDTLDILNYRRATESPMNVEDLLAGRKSGLYVFALCAYSENQYRTNRPSTWTSVTYEHSAPQPLTEFHWDKRYTPNGNSNDENGVLAFNATPGATYRTVYYRVNTDGDDIKIWSGSVEAEDCGYANANMFSRPSCNDQFITGTYYVMISPVNDDGTLGEAVKSPEWDYVDPGIRFQVSNPRWDENNNPVWDSKNIDEDYLQKYAVEVYFHATSNNPDNARNVGMFKVFPGDSAPYAGFTAILDKNGPGWYFFEVIAETKDVTKALGSDFTDLSPALNYNAPELPKLPAPTAPKWHVAYHDVKENGKYVGQTAYDRTGAMSFTRPVDENGDPADLGRYAFLIYRMENGEPKQVGNPDMSIGNSSPRSYAASLGFIYNEYPSGTYFFKVRCVGDGTTCADSDWVESEQWTYAAPTQQLATPSGLFWETEHDFTGEGAFDIASVWDAVPNAGYYFIEYYWSETEGGSTKYLGGSQEITGYEDYDVFEILQEYMFSKKGKGWYSFHVQAIPADITQYSCSEWSGKSNPIYLTSVLPAVEQPTNLQWHLGYNSNGSTYNKTGLMSFNGTIPNEPPFVDYEIELFRETDNGDVSLGKVETTIWNDRNWATVDAFAFFADEMVTGTYYFTVTALPTNGFHSGSETVTSPTWKYTRPTSELKVTNVSIGSDLSANWTFSGELEHLLEYKVEFSFDADGAKPDSNSPYWGSNHYHNDPPLYVPENFLAKNGNGTYYFRIRTVSKDVEVAAPSEWSDWASVQYTAPSAAFTVSDPVWNGSTPTWTDNVQQDDPLLYYQIRYYYGETADTINYDRCVWDTTYDRLPVQLPEKMLAEYGEGYYSFMVKAVSSDLSKVKSSGWAQSDAPRFFAGLPKLGMPTDLKWHIDYEENWDNNDFVSQTAFERMGSVAFKRPVDENGDFFDQGQYDIRIFRINADGSEKEVNSSGRGIGSTSPVPCVADHGFIYGDLDSGTYFFKVRCRADDGNYASSDWADSRDWADPATGYDGTFTFTRPAAKLETPTGLYWDDRTFENWETGKPDIAAVWTPVDNAVFYSTEFRWSDTENGAMAGSYGSRDIRHWGNEPLHDRLWEHLIAEYGENWYFFSVQAVPADITQYRISEWSAYSIGYPMGFAEDNAEARLDSAINSLPASGATTTQIEAAQSVVSAIPLLDEAMMADNDNNGTVAKLDALETAIGTTTVNDTNAPAGFAADKVKVTGAVLNAGADATLTIGQVDNTGAGGPATLIPTQYSNTIPFTLDIPQAKDTDNDPSNGLTLAIPVKITLPIPANINPAFLVVLHYKQSTNQWEELHMPHVYLEDGQWYAAFTVNSMSPFSLAEMTVEVQPEDSSIRIAAHLASGNNDTKYLCAVYSTDGKLLGINMLDPHSHATRVELGQPVPENYDVKIYAAATGSGWMPIGEAQTIQIRANQQ